MSKKTESKTIPPQPELDLMLGDKTHAYVEWMRDYHPDQFKTQYANRTTHLGFVTEDGEIVNTPVE
jgi:hypothetical protein